MEEKDFSNLRKGNLIKYKGKFTTIKDVYDDVIDVGKYEANSDHLQPVPWHEVQEELINSSIAFGCSAEVRDAVDEFTYVHEIQNWIEDSYGMSLPVKICKLRNLGLNGTGKTL